MEQFFDSSLPEEPIPDVPSFIKTYIAPLTPYIRTLLSFIGPLLPPFFRAVRVSYRLLAPLLHTLHLISLSVASVTLSTVLRVLYAVPPSFTPVLILGSVLLGLWFMLVMMRLVRRVTAFFMGLMFRLGLLGVLIAMAWYVKERGVSESLRDVGWGVGVLTGWWEEGKVLGDERVRDWERHSYGQR